MITIKKESAVRQNWGKEDKWNKQDHEMPKMTVLIIDESGLL
jgi:hypothetical protein